MQRLERDRDGDKDRGRDSQKKMIKMNLGIVVTLNYPFCVPKCQGQKPKQCKSKELWELFHSFQVLNTLTNSIARVYVLKQ